ncbi:receptor expression-enhancing protein 4 isoform X3 [Erinaceus europaeus]|uniref:Receptor expression-enhancing protein 4 isoform X3 n=1 Tax=Erinaceus europaeus TaxID=9365 RepID=A0ABM3WDY5_ERIEU|nr:receptor expression-enhancing protein 4 isoform X3 [Erinaceus europaeus]
MDDMSPGGAGVWIALPSLRFLQGSEDQEHPGVCPVDDVLDCLCTLHGGGDLHRHLYFLEIDLYIVQAKERSYETVLSFGKRGLNIAASAAVQAATKSQGALAGRLRSFSMQDLRSIPDGPAPPYQDPLYLEDQAPHRRPPIGYRAGGLHDSDSEDECWSDTEAMSQPPARAREKPLSRSQSLRVIKRKPLTREGTSRSLKVRTRKKAIPSDLDS